MVTARILNDEWKKDDDLKDALVRYVKQNLRRAEILDFVSRDFDEYAWSLRSLDRRLEYFDIRYTDRSVEIPGGGGGIISILKGTTKGTTEDVLKLNTLKGTKTSFLTPKRYDEHPRHFYMGVHPPGLRSTRLKLQ